MVPSPLAPQKPLSYVSHVATVAAVERINAPTRICLAWFGVNADPHAFDSTIRAPK